MAVSRSAIGVLACALAIVGCAADDGAPASPSSKQPTDVAPAGSAGCGTSTAVAGETRETVTSGAEERWYLQHLPTDYDPDTPTPVVLDFHGYGEGAEVHTDMSSLGAYGDEQGFVTITPQGIGAVAEWLTELGRRDLDFVGDLLDEVEADLCIDTDRVYATGLSSGARLTSAIACVHGDRIAAVAAVSGVRRIAGCTFSRPVPVVAFHGTADDVVPYTGGLGEGNLDAPAPDGSGRPWRDTLTEEQIEELDAADPPTLEVMAAWAERNGCADETTETGTGPDVTRITWDCPADGTTELYRITDGGHTWPGSDLSVQLAGLLGPTTMTIDANEIMWAFFQDHPRPAAG